MCGSKGFVGLVEGSPCVSIKLSDITVLTVAGLVLKIFLALLPMLLTFMNKRAGMQSLAEIDYGVMTKYFIFQVGGATPCTGMQWMWIQAWW